MSAPGTGPVLAPPPGTGADAARGTTAAPAPGTTAVPGPRRRGRSRRTFVQLGLVVLLLVVGGAALTLGDFPLPLREVLASLAGQGTRAADLVVHGLRLPRFEAGLAVGFAFGLAGAVCQTLLRNPLASPDVIGLSAGASAGAVVALLLLGWSGTAVAGSALGGALLTAAAIHLLSWRGGASGPRLVLVGIGVAAVLYAVVDLLMTRARVHQAQQALVWLTGSLNGVPAGSLLPLVAVVAVAVLLAPLAGRTLTALQLGDDTARALGTGVERSRLLLMLLVVVLTAVATSVAGPVGFVAFVSAPLARRLTRDAGPGLLTAGLVGAAVVTLADVLGQHLLPVDLPVGVVTAAVGAPYLIHLLARTSAASAPSARG